MIALRIGRKPRDVAPIGGRVSAAPSRPDRTALARARQLQRSPAADSHDPAARKREPHVDGLIGWKAGGAGFNYSPALAQSGIVWFADAPDA
jgi:hypothetical protein